jgi:hypothetical protein
MTEEELMTYPIREEFPELKEKITPSMMEFIERADGIVRARYVSYHHHEEAMDEAENDLSIIRQRAFKRRLRIEELEDEIIDMRDRYEPRRG